MARDSDHLLELRAALANSQWATKDLSPPSTKRQILPTTSVDLIVNPSLVKPLDESSALADTLIVAFQRTQ